MLLLTIMLCVAPQLLFAAALTASINKEQQSRQAMGTRHKAIITYDSTSETIKRLLMLALQSLAHKTIQSPAFNVLATLTIYSHSCPSTYTCLPRSLKLYIC